MLKNHKKKKKNYLKEKDNLQIFTFKKCLRQLLFLEIVSVRNVKNKLIICMCIKWWWGVAELGKVNAF